MQVLSLFSGIGAFEKAFKNRGIPYDLIACCEIDKYASRSYSAIHNVPESMNLLDITKVDEKALPKNIDLITYGFPCQDISIAGKQQGLFNEDGTQTRSGLFFDALRIIEEVQPKVAIAENVKNLTSKKFNAQFQVVLQSLEEAGYNNYFQVLNLKDFGIPQKRERVFIVSIRKDVDTGLFNFPEGFPLELKMKDFLEKEVDEKYYLSPKMVDYILDIHNVQEGTKWEGRADSDVLNPDIAHTLSVRGAGGSQRAGVSNFIIEGLEGEVQVEKLKKQYLAIDKSKNNPQIIDVANCITAREDRGISNRQGEGTAIVELSENGLRIRKLTPKECFRLMGFDDADFEKAEAVNSNAQLYKQAGNSIGVPVLEYIMEALFISGILERKKETQMSMELKVQEFTFPEVINFNFEELKAALQEKISKYENHVYTEGQMTEAKKDLADLRKFTKAMSDERIRIKKEYMKPCDEFEAKIKELDAIVQKPIEQINNQVKFYEDEMKARKRKDIETLWEKTEIQLPIPLTLDHIFNEKWLNSSVKMSAIEKEINERLEQIENDLKTLANLPEFSFEATEVYKDTLDMNKAITEGQRLAEMQKRKAEATVSKVENVPPTPSAPVESVEDVNKQWISFKALLSNDDALALKNFFAQRNIVFEKI